MSHGRYVYKCVRVAFTCLCVHFNVDVLPGYGKYGRSKFEKDLPLDREAKCSLCEG